MPIASDVLARSSLLCGVLFGLTGCNRSDGATLARFTEAEPGASGTAAAVLAPASSAGRESVVLPPRVSLDGSTRALAIPGETDAARAFARSSRTWIYERPSEGAPRLGYLRAGGSVSVGSAVVGTGGCPGGWRAVVPRGYVCVGVAATLDPSDPVVRALSAHPPEAARKLPYIYGTVRKPGPVYARLPTIADLESAEPHIEERMERWLAADGEVGAHYAQSVWLGPVGAPIPPPDAEGIWRDRRTEGVPAFLADGSFVPNLHQKPRDEGQVVIGHTRAKVGYSFTETFVWQGRRYGLTPELEILPTDRLRPIQGSDFHGVELGRGVDLPIALVRQPGARYVALDRGEDRLAGNLAAPYREAVPLSGRQQFFHGVLHYETKDGKWLGDRDASRLDPVKKVPAWAKRGDRWIDVNITKQTLVLYEGTKPVYATLISSGEAGLGDSAQTTATRRGIFRIHSKHVTTTMASDEVGEEFELRDVPYVQYFDDGGHALHGAYWHDRFGIPKSHGCINLAPEDARRIFYFTEPNVPDGWHGAFDARQGTILFIHP